VSVESIPNVIHSATKLWSALPADTKKLQLTNVYYWRAVAVTNYTGVLKGGNLLLVGKCVERLGDVAGGVETG
jgi:hypothetical protein